VPSGLEDLLEIVGLEVTVEGVRDGTLSQSWRERVPDCRSCNTETAAYTKSDSSRNSTGPWAEFDVCERKATRFFQQESCTIPKMSARCTIGQHARGFKLESPSVPSTDCWAVRAKIRQKRPSR